MCGGRFTVPVYQRGLILALSCPKCGARPMTYYVDARTMRDSKGNPIGKKFTKDREGKRFYSYAAADQFVQAMRFAKGEGKLKTKDWHPEEIGKRRISVVGEKWVEGLRRDSGRGHASQMERFLSKYVVPSIGDQDVRAIASEDLEDLKRRMQRAVVRRPDGTEGEASPRLVAGVVGCLGALLTYCHQLEIIDRMPHVPDVSYQPAERAVLDDDRFASVVARVEDPKLKLLYRTLRETGIRPGEGIALKCRDLARGGLVVQRAFDQYGKLKATKTGAVLRKQLSDALFSELSVLADGRFGEEFLFVNARGNYYRGNFVSRVWSREALALGIDVPLYPATKHSHLTDRYAELLGQANELIAAEAGHTSSRMTLGHYVNMGTVSAIRDKRGQDSGS